MVSKYATTVEYVEIDVASTEYIAEYTEVADILRLGETDPEYAEHLKTAPTPVTPWHDVPKMRAQMAALRASRKGPSPEPSAIQRITMRDGYQHYAAVFKPEVPPLAGSPLVILLHGGGFIQGAKEAMAPLANGLSKRYGATAVCLPYRLAPEYKFPTAPNDVWDSIRWLADNAGALGASIDAGFVLGGASAGANLAAVAAQRAVDEGFVPKITGLWLNVPVVLHRDIVPEEYRYAFLARDQNQNAKVINAESMSWVKKYYAQDVYSRQWSPFNSPHAHTGMPPTYIQVAGQDPVRDDGLIYERALRAHGVQTRLDVYPGVPHGHAALLPHLKASKKAVADTMTGFGWLLENPC